MQLFISEAGVYRTGSGQGCQTCGTQTTTCSQDGSNPANCLALQREKPVGEELLSVFLNIGVLYWSYYFLLSVLVYFFTYHETKTHFLQFLCNGLTHLATSPTKWDAHSP